MFSGYNKIIKWTGFQVGLSDHYSLSISEETSELSKSTYLQKNVLSVVNKMLELT